MTGQLHVVTGALGFSGKYMAELLLDEGHRVRTLTNSPDRPNPFGERLEIAPLCFDDPGRLAASLKGAKVLYNTYWVRFNHRGFNHEDAVRNTFLLFMAAMQAGVERIVHVSITNNDEQCGLEYFRGKARIERMLRETGMGHTILRPAVLFGREDILLNNLAWGVRAFPLVFVFGDGEYGIRPIHVRDLARLAVREGDESGMRVVNAVGPERFTFRELIRTVGRAIGVDKRIVGLPPSLAHALAWTVGRAKGDVFLTRDEITALMEGRLDVEDGGADRFMLEHGIRLSEWVVEHGRELGRRYASELGRRRDRASGYDDKEAA